MEGDFEIVASRKEEGRKKETVLERLNKRNKDRHNDLETKLELRNKQHTEIEDADNFVQAFSERAKQIEKNINNVQDNGDLTRTFAAINTDIQELQKYLSNSTLFLPDYNIKACQNIVNELSTRSEELRQKLMPKKKFGFNGKKVGLKSVQKNGVDKVDSSGKASLSSLAFQWTVSNRRDEYILLVGSEVDRKDITISDLQNCFVEIRGHAGSVQISKTDNCIFLCGPITRSLFAEFCNNCSFSVACQQLRLHSSVNCKLYLHVTCRAIIEDCIKIVIGSYNYEYSGIGIDFKKAGLDENVNNYRDVADFNWLSPDKPSPNWQLYTEEETAQVDWNSIADKFKLTKTL